MENKTLLLNESALKYAKEQLNETKLKRFESVREIQKWLEENPKINSNKNEEAILPFLRGCKYDMERTKKKIKNYYDMKRDVPEWFLNRNPMLDHLQELFKLGILIPLEELHENKTVIIIRPAAHNPKIYKIDDFLKAGLMITDILAISNELLQIYGVIAIFDLDNISFEHVRQLTPSVIKKTVNSWENYHCRPKQLEFINAPFYINFVLKIFKSFMNEKMKQRIRVHPYGIEYASTIVPSDILPKEYGGKSQSIYTLSENWANKLIAYKDWFEAEEKFKSNH